MNGFIQRTKTDVGESGKQAEPRAIIDGGTLLAKRPFPTDRFPALPAPSVHKEVGLQSHIRTTVGYHRFVDRNGMEGERIAGPLISMLGFVNTPSAIEVSII